MKRRTFYHLTLLLPYVALVFSVGFVFLTSALDNLFSSPSSLEFFAGLVAFFAITGIVWGPLYTWMVIVMLIWSRGRKTEEVRLLYLLSPALLACSMGIPAVTMSMPYSLYFLLDGFLRMNNMGYVSSALLRDLRNFDTAAGMFAVWFFMAGICIVVGYAFVGTVVWFEKMLRKQGRLKDESETVLEYPLPREANSILDKDPIQQTADGDASVP